MSHTPPHSQLTHPTPHSLTIDPEKSAQGNPITIKRDRDRAKAATGRQAQKRLSHPRHLHVSETYAKLQSQKRAMAESLIKSLKASLLEKETEKEKWLALMRKVCGCVWVCVGVWWVCGGCVGGCEYVVCQGQGGNGSSKGCTPTRISDADEAGLEEGEIASPVDAVRNEDGVRRILVCSPGGGGRRSLAVPRR